MKNLKRMGWGIVLALGVTAALHAQSEIAGKWVGETQGRGGPQTVTLELAVKGSELSGTITQGPLPAGPITDAKIVDATTVTFNRTIEGRGGQITINYTAVVKGGEMTLTPVFPGGGGRGGGGPITLKRQ